MLEELPLNVQWRLPSDFWKVTTVTFAKCMCGCHWGTAVTSQCSLYTGWVCSGSLMPGCGGHKQAWTPWLWFLLSHCAGGWARAQVDQSGCVWISSNIFLNIFWIYSKVSWMWSWANGSGWPYLSQGLELDGFQRSLLSPVWTACLQVLGKKQWDCVIFMKRKNPHLYLSR